MEDPLIQMGDPANPYNQAESFIDCECPTNGGHFAWSTITVPPDQIIICKICRQNHIIGEIGDLMSWDVLSGWYVDEGWRVKHMSHDRGCHCGKERGEYESCQRPTCQKRGMWKTDPLHTTQDGPDNRDDRLKGANARQPGGSHYKPGSELQHWDVISEYGVGYLEGCATKYLCRWRSKAGMLDLEKALHYTEKLAELVKAGKRKPAGQVHYDVIDKFCKTYELWPTDETACVMLLRWTKDWQLETAAAAIRRTIEHAKQEGFK